MGTISPTLSHAFWLLRNDMYIHLEQAEYLAMVDDDWESHELESARKLILDLVEVIRTVVAQHEDNRYGGCRFCLGQSWPCASIQSVHSVLRNPDREFVQLVAAKPVSD